MKKLTINPRMFILAFLLGGFTPLTWADDKAIPSDTTETVFARDILINPQIDFAGFVRDVNVTRLTRERRLVTVERFLKLSQEPGTIILDTRSKANYDLKHLKGATHLNFSELTKSSLEQAIPNKKTQILIYCNNNFKNNSPAFPPKNVSAALNIPTFVTLHSYGYENVYELGTLEDEKNTKLKFEGTFPRK